MMHINEEWKTIESHPHYMVSNYGRVLSPPNRNHRKAKILSPGTNKRGYKFYTLKDGHGKQTYFFEHILVVNAFIGKKPNGYQTNHINGIKDDNRVKNLEIVTPKENMQHAFATGLHKRPYGESNPNAKLTEYDVKIIMCLEGEMKRLHIAQKFKVSKSCIASIYQGRTWSDVTGRCYWENN